MPVAINIEVKNLEETQQRLERMAQKLRGAPMMMAIRNATLIVQRQAKLNLQPWRGPGTGGVDTGRLRASITPSVWQRGSEFIGVVGTNVFYAGFQEFGTRPHWVGAANIGKWAQRHGLGYKAVFVSGTPLRYMERAINDTAPRIAREIGNAVATVTGDF